MKLSGRDFSLFEPARWNETTSEFIVTAKFGWKKLRAIAFSVNTLSETGPTGFVLPFYGILFGDKQITISTNAREGAVAPEPVDLIPAVGSFGGTTSLRFDPPLAGSVTTANFSFVSRMPIRAGESITVSFRGMAAEGVHASEPEENPYVVRRQVFPDEVLTVMRYDVPSPGYLAGNRVSILFPGLRLPIDGIGNDHNGLLVSTDARLGPVNHSQIQNWQFVGAFLLSNVDFPLPEAGDNVLNIDISISTSMKIRPGEVIQLYLEGFSGVSQSLQVESAPTPGKIQSASWEGQTSIITMTVGKEIAAREGIKIVITRSTIAMPADGISSDGSKPMLISTDAAAGPVLPVQIQSVGAVGVISDTTLEFENPVAGEISGLRIGFRLSSTVSRFDEVIVMLPGITRDLKSQTFFTESSFWSEAEWMAARSILRIKSIDSKEAGHFFEVVIDKDQKFKIPDVGIQRNQDNFLIRSLAKTGPTLAQKFEAVSAVGSFTNSTVMYFMDEKDVFAGNPSSFAICFTAQAPFAIGDKVSLILPDFTKSDTYRSKRDEYVESVWFSANNSLEMTIHVRLDAKQKICHTSDGLSVPLQGIRSYDRGIKIATDSVEGPVRPISVFRVPRVGALESSRLFFDRALAGNGAMITVQLTPLMIIESGRTIQVHLPGYHRGLSTDISGCTSVSSCSWDESEKLLVVSNLNAVAERESFTFSVPKAAGIRLPDEGVRPDVYAHTVSIQANDRNGNVNPTKLIDVQTVGSFSKTRLEFFPKPPVTRRAIEIRLQFSYINGLKIGDIVAVQLPGFYSETQEDIVVINNEIDGSSWSKCSWSQSEETLKMTASRAIPGGALSNILIPEVTAPWKVGLLPPLSGSLVNNTLLAILTEVTQGPVLPTSIEISDAIGSLGADASISFSEPRAGYVTDVKFKFVTGMILDNTDTIVVFLKHFTLGGAWTGQSLDFGPAGSRQYIFQAQVSSVNESTKVGVEISLTPSARIPLSTPLFIQIPREAGVTIPVDGVKLNDEKHTVRAEFAAGSVPERSLDVVPSVGAFRRSELSYSPRKVRTGIEMTLVIETYMNILEGEQLVLHLPGFTVKGPMGPSDVAMGIARSSPEGYVQSESGDANCEWRRSGATVNCLVAKSIPARQVITIKYALAWTAMRAVSGQFEVHEDNSPAYLWVPNDGIETNDEEYAISTNAKGGPVKPTPIKSVMGVMAVFGVHGLKVLPLDREPVPFAASRLSLTFASSLKLQKGDHITLILPGFQRCKCPYLECKCEEPDRIPINTSQPDILGEIALWHEGAGGYAVAEDTVGEMCVGCGVAGSCYASQLKFEVNSESVEPKTSITVEIPKGYVRLPVDGISKVLNPVMLQTETVAGVLTPFSIAIEREVPAVITDLSLQLGSPVAASVSEISLNFRLNAPVEKGSKLSISLPSFIRDESWTYRGGSNRANETVEVVCTASSRSREYGGLCDARESVCCDPSPLEHASKIVESFGPSGKGVQSSVKGGPKDEISIFQRAEWNPVEQTVILELTSDLTWNGSALDIHVSIPSSAGIRVPVSGLATRNPYMSARIFLNVPGAIPTTNLVIHDFPTVPPLFSSSKISFIRSEANMDTNVGMDVEFALASLSSDRYAITLLLPGFSRAVEGTSDLAGTVLVCFNEVCRTVKSRNAQASWDETAGKLALMGLETGMQNVSVKINVAKDAGMKRPPEGVDASTGLMLAVRVDNPADKSPVELKTSFDEEEKIDVITRVALDFQPRVAGKPASISAEFELSFDMLSGDTVTLFLPGFTGADIPFIPNIRVNLDCRIPHQVGLQKSPNENCAEKSYNTLGEEICRPGGLCKPNWYGQQCESYCDDVTTCNLDKGLGFCNLFGTCTCFPPHNGRFCNTTHEVPAEENCAALPPIGSISPNMQVSFAASWTQSSSALTLTATGTIYVPATTIVNISVPTNGSEGATINLPDTGLPSPKGEMQLSVQKAGEQSATTASRISAHAPVVRFRCRTSILNIPNAPLCDGLHTVRVCARSQDDADAYATNVARPLLEKVTKSTCLDETCGVGGAQIGATKQSCCMVRAVADLGVCATDADCMGIDTRAEQEDEGVPLIDETCCHFCNQTLSQWCRRPIKACTSCSKSMPCSGYKLSKGTTTIDRKTGGAVMLDSGSGIIVPANVWPTTRPLQMEVYSESFAVETVSGGTQISEALLFGPSPLVFPEPGVTMSFQISPELANPPPGFMIAAFKIVNGIPIQHPFVPVVNTTSGLVQVKTLGFSAYVLMMMPTPIVITPVPGLPVIDLEPDTEAGDDSAPPEAEQKANPPLSNPRSPLFVTVVSASALVFCGLLIYAYGWYLKLSRSVLKKERLLDGDSYRMHEEHEPEAESMRVLATDLVAADGEDMTPPSSRIGRSDVERILSLGDGMDEHEPPAQNQDDVPGTAGISLLNIFGSVGLIGTGARVPRDVRPVPSEVQSTVFHAGTRPEQVEMTADLVVIDQMGAEEDMEEAEPVMEEAEPMKQGEWDSDPYYAQEFEQFSSSAPESSGSRSDRQTPIAVPLSDKQSLPVAASEVRSLQNSQEHDVGANLRMSFDGGEDQEEAEPWAQEISVDEQDEYEPTAEEISNGDELEPGAEEILHFSERQQ